jgi:hypothetical protein
VFTTWIFAQRDRNDSVGLLGKLLFNDYNAGCAGGGYDPLAWMEHFYQKHPKASEMVKLSIGDAYSEYLDEMNRS